MARILLSSDDTPFRDLNSTVCGGCGSRVGTAKRGGGGARAKDLGAEA